MNSRIKTLLLGGSVFLAILVAYFQAAEAQPRTQGSAASITPGLEAEGESSLAVVIASPLHEQERREVHSGLQFRVRTLAGSPAAGYVVAIASGANLHSWKMTDRSGDVQFEPLDGPLDAYALLDGGLVSSVELASGTGTHLLEVTPPTDVSGRAFVDGALANAGVAFGLSWPELPAVPDVLLPLLQELGPVEFRASSEGTFHFRAPAPGVAGKIALPWWLETTSGEDMVNVRAGVREIVLHLQHRPVITGRAVEQHTGLPAENSAVQYWMTSSSQEERGVIECEEDGRFRIPISSSNGLTGGRFLATAENGSNCQATVGAVQGGMAHHLGDLVLLETRKGLVEVIDEMGLPIEGATLYTVDGAPVDALASDAQGRIRVDSLGAGLRSIEVSAAARKTSAINLPASSNFTVTAILEPLNCLEIKVLSEDGVPIPNLFLTVKTETPAPFEAPFSTRADGRRFLLESTRPNRSIFEDSGPRWVYRTTRTGSVVIAGLEPDLRLRIKVGAHSGSTLIENHVVRVGPRGPQEEVLTIQGSPTYLGGQISGVYLGGQVLGIEVVNEAGVRISGANVKLGLDSGMSKATDSKGSALFHGLLGTNLDVTVSADGYCPTRRVITLPASDEGDVHVELMELQVGQTVDLFILNADGNPAPVPFVHLEQGGFRVGKLAKVSVGHFRVSGLPPGEYSMVVTAGGIATSAAAPVVDGSMTMTLPPYGSLVVNFDEGSISPVKGAASRTLEIQSTTGMERIFVPVDSGDYGKSIRIPIVFPGSYHARWSDKAEKASKPVDVVANAEANIHVDL